MTLSRRRRTRARKILVVTGSRGEYGYIRPVFQLMKRSGGLEPEVLATNMHLIPEFGGSISEFARDDIPVRYRIFMSLAGYTSATMAKSLGVFLTSLVDILDNNPPDILLLAGDRGEQLMAAIAGAHLNIPVAHIQAGEISGNIDGLSRQAIARFAHVHFTSHREAADRLIQSGEQEFRVFNVGAPQLDEFRGAGIAPPAAVAERIGIRGDDPLLLVVQHPVTEQWQQAQDQMRATMEAVLPLGLQTVVIYPNNDAGSIAVQEAIQECRRIDVKIERNVPREVYAGLMNMASVIVGNSSSGIIEAPSFGLPAVNIGRRQEGRFRAANVIDVPAHDARLIRAAIGKAMSPRFRSRLAGLVNPYGDGHASERIVKVLQEIPLNEELLFKKMTY